MAKAFRPEGMPKVKPHRGGTGTITPSQSGWGGTDKRSEQVTGKGKK